MPSIVHTCDGCGEPLTVPDRYLGRSLRCPRCGAEFTAAAPSGGTGLPPLPATGTSSAPRRWWLGVLAVLPLLALVIWLSLPKETTGRLFSRQVFSGQVMTVVPSPTGRDSFGAIDRERVQELTRLAAGGEGSLDPVPPGVVRIPAGTRVSVVEHRRAEGVVVARVLDGSWSGRTLWIPAQWLK